MQTYFLIPMSHIVRFACTKSGRPFVREDTFFLKTLFLAGQGRSEGGRQDPTPPDTHVVTKLQEKN